MDPVVGVVGVDIGAAPGLVPQPVHHGVLHLQGEEAVIPQFSPFLGYLHRRREGGIHVFLPGIGTHLPVQGFQVGAVKLLQPQHHPAGDAGPEAKPVRRLQGSGEFHAGTVDPLGDSAGFPDLPFQKVFHV